ncbi:biotin carboxyl carrier protein of acetyl-CoA carboxylase 2, chloroplastic-like isoform X2 [Salvia miltiorrhiza]|uniref:biotin carboxyl carrier protein of acetyl-CoA carboxylase 2, chloroplastic-like isoform X2 n=1 Tax=Salvia miltiorrhiza TaxID=226208 RepID=UPI0025AD34B6|nr:biotin carboxyl carrier protein of acetyl-CoA carboxylase 2, chloroplastic-like isoform X2 [Salvia miltiorrhiza]
MASFTVPCPKVSPPLAASSQHVALFPRSGCRMLPFAKVKGLSRNQSDDFKVSAQLNEVAVEKASLLTERLKESKSQYEIPDAESVSAFMNQVSDLIKLVDSRDIVELQLKQLDCELVIRKKEALPQPSTSAPVFYAPPPTAQATLSPPPTTNVPAPASSTPSAPALPAPAKPKSSHPPFKCPMAGNFYRSPAPGAPPFVKVGDKVQKGQVICIIEAMKLMNDIEADQSGTVVEILADDGKPVSVDTPLFIIEP